MENTNNTPELNPKIKEKAEELFNLLEDEIKKSHEDPLAEAMSEQLGDFIKNSKGFDQLLYAYELSQTQSEKAIYGLEESVYHMNDEAFFTLTQLYEEVLQIAEIWNTPKEERHKNSSWHFQLAIKEAESAAKKVEKKYKRALEIQIQELQRGNQPTKRSIVNFNQAPVSSRGFF